MLASAHTPVLLLELWPDKAQYRPDEPIGMSLRILHQGTSVLEGMLDVKLHHLERLVWHRSQPLPLGPGTSEIALLFPGQPDTWAGFGITATFRVKGMPDVMASTAVDVAADWSITPRYGFLSDFSPPGAREDGNASLVQEEVRSLARFHLNIIQFYDWMYRHDTLLPPQDIFVDPLGRTLSLEAVTARIEACEEAGMKTMAYGAIYGASAAFQAEHPTWSFHRNDGVPLSFGNWLYIMNTSAQSPWREHITNQFAEAVRVLGFDGIHLDTYGWPKVAYASPEAGGALECLETHFPGFVDGVRTALSDARPAPILLFNAVGDWPSDAAALTGTEAAYVEVWDPNDRYIHLHQLIQKSRRTQAKPVILAAYLAPFTKTRREESTYVQADAGEYCEHGALRCLQYTAAVIAASGGHHLVLGGRNGVLTNNYYCEHATLTPWQAQGVLRYADFMVRYTELLYHPSLRDLSMTHANGINTEFRFEGAETASEAVAGKVWTCIRQGDGMMLLHLINLTGIRDDRWNLSRNEPASPVACLTIDALVYERVSGVFHASPDGPDGGLTPLEWEWVPHTWGRAIRFSIRDIDVWSMVYIRLA